LTWQRAPGATFTDNRYSREHTWHFDGGLELPASASPQIVPLPMSNAAALDPEEAFVAALASCHLLWFLSIAARRGFVVERYRDVAAGSLAKDTSGKLAMTEVTLRPQVAFAGPRQPTPEEHAALHHEAHSECFLARSVTSRVRCEPSLLPA
jgi:organic hydroperoxide reductase OsmC/OhrA